MKKITLLLLLTTVCISLRATPPEDVLSLEKKHEMPIILASFAKSGNTWMRYCLEYFTKRPSAYMRVRQHKDLHSVKFDNPIGNALNLEIDHSRPFIYKAHNIGTELCGLKDGLLVLVVRNYKDCLIRAHESRFGMTPTFNELMEHFTVTKKKKGYVNYSYYFTNFIEFEKWDPAKRFLIYYEDLISNPQPIFKSLLQFLGEDENSLEEFMLNYDDHKKRCIGFYEKNYPLNKLGRPHIDKSANSNIKKLPEEDFRKLDEYVIKTYPEIWKKYLKRYTPDQL